MATKLRTPYNAIGSRSQVSVPVSEKIDESQVLNNAGGFVFQVTPMVQLERFLVLGTVGGTYYASESKLTRKNATEIEKLIKSDGLAVVQKIVEMVKGNRVPKMDPALFVLALAASVGDAKTKLAVSAALPEVATIGTHIFTFVEYAQQFRGWGRSLREMVARWYTSKAPRDLAYQTIKYQNRNGWSHRDLLRLSHAKTSNDTLNGVFRWAVKGWDGVGEEPHPDYALRQIWAFEHAKRATTEKEIVRLINEYDLPRECIPTQFLKSAAVWEALLQKMPMTAMVRNLATMSRVGLLVPMSDAGRIITERLTDVERIRKSRMHPIQLLSAHRVYRAGGQQGAWSRSRKSDPFTPVQPVVDALDKAFTLSFGNVEPSGKRILMGLDVSGSMGSGEIDGVPGLTPREAEAAMALVTARTEWANGAISYPLYHSMAFETTFKEFPISPKDTLESITKRMERMNFGGTNCSLPMEYALKSKMSIDTFVVYTDDETWAGGHPSQALKNYRQKMGIDARLVVVAFTADKFTIADPTDRGMLDVAGFDSAAPSIITKFSKGEL